MEESESKDLLVYNTHVTIVEYSKLHGEPDTSLIREALLQKGVSRPLSDQILRPTEPPSLLRMWHVSDDPPFQTIWLKILWDSEGHREEGLPACSTWLC